MQWNAMKWTRINWICVAYWSEYIICAMSTDKLIEIPPSQLVNLRDLYLKDWPVNMLGYYTIDNYIRWIDKQATIKDLFVYSLNGDWSDGTFAVMVSKS